MNSSSDLSVRVVESLSALEPSQPSPRLNAALAKPLKTMTIYRILEIRCAIVAALNPNLPVVSSALDLIDGQIALRAIAGEEGWR